MTSIRCCLEPPYAGTEGPFLLSVGEDQYNADRERKLIQDVTGRKKKPGIGSGIGICGQPDQLGRDQMNAVTSSTPFSFWDFSFFRIFRVGESGIHSEAG